eukprot:5250766-Amphidinium_carterae.1
MVRIPITVLDCIWGASTIRRHGGSHSVASVASNAAVFGSVVAAAALRKQRKKHRVARRAVETAVQYESLCKDSMTVLRKPPPGTDPQTPGFQKSLKKV